MRTRCWRRFLLALLLAVLLPAAHAAITCTSITSPGAIINYESVATVGVQTSFSVSCTRGNTGDPLSVSYTVAVDNGTHTQVADNKAASGQGTRIIYDTFTTAACTTRWEGATKIADTITWSAGATGTITRQTSFWVCVVSQPMPTVSGQYTDTVGMTLTYPGGTVIGTAGVTIYAPALCTVTTAPGTINVTYMAMGPQVIASTPFGVTCTIGMPYAMATDVYEDRSVGLRYLLATSAATANGTGAAQNFSIIVTVPAGQAGTCTGSSCTAARTRTLTITY